MKERDQKSTAPASRDFPALSDFLRGYLHQDMRDEHGSVAKAAQDFWQAADIDERIAVAEDWKRLREQFKHRPVSDLNRALTSLGSAQLLEASDIETINAVLNQG